jgi:hypothetical protein
MQDNPFACATVVALAYAIVGALFGGLAGWLTVLSGRAAGGPIGRSVAAAMELSSAAARSAVAGAVDGALFLGTVGFFIGFFSGWPGAPYAIGGVVALTLSAAVFGGFAYLLVQRRHPQLAAVFGALIGGAAAAILSEGAGAAIVLCAMLGCAAGASVASRKTGDEMP